MLILPYYLTETTYLPDLLSSNVLVVNLYLRNISIYCRAVVFEDKVISQAKKKKPKGILTHCGQLGVCGKSRPPFLHVMSKKLEGIVPI